MIRKFLRQLFCRHLTWGEQRYFDSVMQELVYPAACTKCGKDMTKRYTLSYLFGTPNSVRFIKEK